MADLRESLKGMLRFHLCSRHLCEFLIIFVELNDVDFELLKAPATACITVGTPFCSHYVRP
jgi:hypothetical protein